MASACTAVNDSYSICSNLESAGVGIGALLNGLLSQGLIGFIIVIGIVMIVLALVGAVGKMLVGLFSGVSARVTKH